MCAGSYLAGYDQQREQTKPDQHGPVEQVPYRRQAVAAKARPFVRMQPGKAVRVEGIAGQRAIGRYHKHLGQPRLAQSRPRCARRPCSTILVHPSIEVFTNRRPSGIRAIVYAYAQWCAGLVKVRRTVPSLKLNSLTVSSSEPESAC